MRGTRALLPLTPLLLLTPAPSPLFSPNHSYGGGYGDQQYGSNYSYGAPADGGYIAAPPMAGASDLDFSSNSYMASTGAPAAAPVSLDLQVRGILSPSRPSSPPRTLRPNSRLGARVIHAPVGVTPPPLPPPPLQRRLVMPVRGSLSALLHLKLNLTEDPRFFSSTQVADDHDDIPYGGGYQDTYQASYGTNTYGVPPSNSQYADNSYYAAPAPVDNAYGGQPAYGVPDGTYGAPQDMYGAPQDSYGVPQDAHGVAQGTYSAPDPVSNLANQFSASSLGPPPPPQKINGKWPDPIERAKNRHNPSIPVANASTPHDDKPSIIGQRTDAIDTSDYNLSEVMGPPPSPAAHTHAPPALLPPRGLRWVYASEPLFSPRGRIETPLPHHRCLPRPCSRPFGGQYAASLPP